jgi:hypothetical protein
MVFLRETGPLPSAWQNPAMAFACDHMKAIGKRYEGKPHVPFDERVVEIESWHT